MMSMKRKNLQKNPIFQIQRTSWCRWKFFFKTKFCFKKFQSSIVSIFLYFPNNLHIMMSIRIGVGDFSEITLFSCVIGCTWLSRGQRIQGRQDSFHFCNGRFRREDSSHCQLTPCTYVGICEIYGLYMYTYTYTYVRIYVSFSFCTYVCMGV